MTQVFEAVYENGMLRPLEVIQLSEHERVRVIVENLPKTESEKNHADLPDDPLQGFEISLGISDFSERFNDYRLGGRKP
jgi:predicted DNA-binding antitoxin AbrB/MazE fold protein